jgi:hypothetical protein
VPSAWLRLVSSRHCPLFSLTATVETVVLDGGSRVMV